MEIKLSLWLQGERKKCIDIGDILTNDNPTINLSCLPGTRCHGNWVSCFIWFNVAITARQIIAEFVCFFPSSFLDFFFPFPTLVTQLAFLDNLLMCPLGVTKTLSHLFIPSVETSLLLLTYNISLNFHYSNSRNQDSWI